MRILLLVIGLLIVSCAKLGDDKEWKNPADPDNDCIKPVLESVNDTVVMQDADVLIKVEASDEDGEIERYFWDRGANGWDDSTTAAEYEFSNPDGGEVTVIWGAKDNDNQIKTDTFSIKYNFRPDKIEMKNLDDGDTVSWVDFIDWRGSYTFKFSASDPDDDDLVYKLFLSTRQDELLDNEAYSGNKNTATCDTLATFSKYYWKLRILDPVGNFRDTDGNFYTRTAGMRSIPSKGETYLRGTLKDEDPFGSYYTDSRPQHEVTFTYNYWIDTTEVTQYYYNKAMESVYGDIYNKPSEWSIYGEGNDRPAYYVNWYEAVLYCNARTKLEGREDDTAYSYTSMAGQIGSEGQFFELNDIAIDFTKTGYRLPTCAEWEFACRAGKETFFYWGEDTSEVTLDKYAWYSGNITDSELQPVAQKLPNIFKLYDMIGNAQEWCNDASYKFDSTAVSDPTGPDFSYDQRIARGAFVDSQWHLLGSSYRGANIAGNYHYKNGFRLACGKIN